MEIVGLTWGPGVGHWLGVVCRAGCWNAQDCDCGVLDAIECEQEGLQALPPNHANGTHKLARDLREAVHGGGRSYHPRDGLRGWSASKMNSRSGPR